MNTFLHWFTSPEWTLAVKALLHTLWQGAAIAVALGLLLRRMRTPVLRHRCSLIALAGVLISGIVTWAVLNRPLPVPGHDTAAVAAAASQTLTSDSDGQPAVVMIVPLERETQSSLQWTAWIALAWFAGAVVMLGRAGIQVAGAEHLRRSARPLDEPHIHQLLTEARRALGLTRTIRVAVTDKLTSPAVVGVLLPTLVLPLSLVTTLSQEQVRFILLHELAHIRRGDYFANLFQLFAEALLFFNPAVWWISHQVRREREACCDALAIELSGAPVDYAKTLVHVAEHSQSPLPAAAPAFGGEREPSSLTDRVQRLLVPGYRPSLRLTWRAMLAALVVGGTLLLLSAVGTRLTVAAILSPEQRLEQIEKKMTEYGVPPVAESNDDLDSSDAPTAEISGHVRMADGSPLPKIRWINFYHSRKQLSAVSSGRLNDDGTYSTFARFGRFRVGLALNGFAPVVSREVIVDNTNRVENLDLVLTPGFDTIVQLTDADTGKPIADASIKAQFWVRDMGTSIGNPVRLTTDSAGEATLAHCSDSVALTLGVNASGYELVDQRFEQLTPQETLKLRLRRGLSLSGVVLSKPDNRPITGATVRLIYEKGRSERRYEWNNETTLLAATDSSGRFTVTQLQPNARYWLGVSAPGRESIITPPLTANAAAQTVLLGPELIVRGRVTGNLEQLQRINSDYCLSRNTSEVFDNHSHGWQDWLPLRVTNGVGYFQFTNRTPGKVTLSANGYREEREVTAPIENWTVELSDVRETEAALLPKREVIFRFAHPSGVPPRGTVSVTLPYSLDRNNLTSHNVEMQITNNEVRVDVAIGGTTRIEPKRTVGYWFKSVDYFTVSNGVGPLVLEIPCIPAGAIYASARNANGTPAGGLLFGVRELKPAPDRKDMGSLDSGSDSFSGNAPRTWVSGPLPLGGTYQVHAWRGNSFSVSKPITLTEANPDAEIELQFPADETFVGVVLDSNGNPVRNAELEATFSLSNGHGFGLRSAFTDGRGEFRLENTTRGVGDYFVQVNAPNQMAERVKLEFGSQPQTIRLKRGHTLAGRVVEADTGLVVPDVEVRASDFEHYKLPMLKTRTDANGRFEFTSLGDTEYRFYVEAGQMMDNRQYRADGSTNLTLTVKLYEWSKARPKRLVSLTSAHVSDEEPGVPNKQGTPASSDPLIRMNVIRANDGRRAIANKLDNIKVNSISLDGVTLRDALSALSDESKTRDPSGEGVNFTFIAGSTPMIDPNTGLPVDVSLLPITIKPAMTDARLVDVLDAIVQVAPTPVRYSIKTNAVAFFASSANPPDPLYTRTFKVNTNGLYRMLNERAGAQGTLASTNVSTRIHGLFSSIGVELQAPKAMYFSDGKGMLLVRAGLKDLDAIEGLLQVINDTPPQVNIKVKLVVMPDEFVNAFYSQWIGTNRPSAPGRLGVMTKLQFQKTMASFEKQDVDIVTTTEVTTLSGRQAQIQIVDIRTIVNGVTAVVTNGQTNFMYQTQESPVGTVMDVIPYVAADGYTIQLTAIPTVTEFLGYDNPRAFIGQAANNPLNNAQPPLPRFRVRQVTTSAAVWDGQTLVLGNFPDQIVTRKPDGSTDTKPFTDNQNKQLFVFLTPTLVDSAGNRVHANEESRDLVPVQAK